MNKELEAKKITSPNSHLTIIRKTFSVRKLFLSDNHLSRKITCLILTSSRDALLVVSYGVGL